MRKETFTCDRCGTTPVPPGSEYPKDWDQIEAVNTTMARVLDLCASCSEAFGRFISEGPARP